MGFGDRSTGRGTFGGEFGARHCATVPQPSELRLAATRPSSQITFGRLVIITSVITHFLCVCAVPCVRACQSRKWAWHAESLASPARTDSARSLLSAAGRTFSSPGTVVLLGMGLGVKPLNVA